MLTEKMIHDAANRLDASGIKPTHRLVRDLLQSGSYSTITQFLKSWKPKGEIAAPIAPNEVGQSVRTFADDVWQAAYAAAEAMASKQTEALAAEVTKLNDALHAITTTADGYAIENDGLRKAGAEKDARLDRALAEVVEQKIALAAARAEIETWRRASARRSTRSKHGKSKSRRKQPKPGSDPSSSPGAPPIAA